MPHISTYGRYDLQSTVKTHAIYNHIRRRLSASVFLKKSENEKIVPADKRDNKE